MKPHKLTLLLCVAACVIFAHCATLSRLGGAGAGAGIGAAVGGPLGAAGGAIAGDAVVNSVVPQPVPPQTVVNAAPGSTVYATHAAEPGWLATYWPWIVAALVLLRFHRYILGFLRTLPTGGLKAAGLNLAALVLDVGAKAKAATSDHLIKRKYPHRPVSPANPVEWEPLPHEGGHGA